MTNEQSGAPMGRHAQNSLSKSGSVPTFPVASCSEYRVPLLQYTGNPVITLDHVTKIYEAQPKPRAQRYIAAYFPWRIRVFLVGHSGSGKVDLHHQFVSVESNLQGQDLYYQMKTLLRCVTLLHSVPPSLIISLRIPGL